MERTQEMFVLGRPVVLFVANTVYQLVCNAGAEACWHGGDIDV
jgi:hypothetical protein